MPGTGPPPRIYVCGLCHATCTATLSDLEALAEFARNFPNHPCDVSDCELVCDACYQPARKGRGHAR